jgi:hypothetical protein
MARKESFEEQKQRKQSMDDNDAEKQDQDQSISPIKKKLEVRKETRTVKNVE